MQNLGTINKANEDQILNPKIVSEILDKLPSTALSAEDRAMFRHLGHFLHKRGCFGIGYFECQIAAMLRVGSDDNLAGHSSDEYTDCLRRIFDNRKLVTVGLIDCRKVKVDIMEYGEAPTYCFDVSEENGRLVREQAKELLPDKLERWYPCI